MAGYYGTVTTLSKVQGYSAEQSRKIAERRQRNSARRRPRVRSDPPRPEGPRTAVPLGAPPARCVPLRAPRRGAAPRCNENDLLKCRRSVPPAQLSPSPPVCLRAVSPFPFSLGSQNLEVEKFAGYTLRTPLQLSSQMRLKYFFFNYLITQSSLTLLLLLLLHTHSSSARSPSPALPINHRRTPQKDPARLANILHFPSPLPGESCGGGRGPGAGCHLQEVSLPPPAGRDPAAGGARGRGDGPGAARGGLRRSCGSARVREKGKGAAAGNAELPPRCAAGPGTAVLPPAPEGPPPASLPPEVRVCSRRAFRGDTSRRGGRFKSTMKWSLFNPVLSSLGKCSNTAHFPRGLLMRGACQVHQLQSP